MLTGNFGLVMCMVTVVTAGCDASGAEVDKDDPALVLDNGRFFLYGEAYIGTVVERFTDGTVKRRASYLAGKRQGLSASFYATGARRDERLYAQGLANGVHQGWWPDGKPKFHFYYVDDKREGLHRQWYRTGAPYTELNYRGDREDGMQRAFRENGKLYINYEIRDGFKYGLSKSALCFSLKDGEIK